MRGALAVAACLLLTSCGAQPIGETGQALCAPNFPGQGAYGLSDGRCLYFAGSGAAVRHITAPAGTSIVSLSISAGSAISALVGDSPTPAAWSYGANYIPTWNGGTSYREQRFKNGDAGAPRFTAYSISWTGQTNPGVAQFPPPPTCPYYYQGHVSGEYAWSLCGTTSDSFPPDYTAASINCPNGGCQVSGAFPDGSGYGAPCYANAADGHQAVVNYACPVY